MFDSTGHNGGEHDRINLADENQPLAGGVMRQVDGVEASAG